MTASTRAFSAPRIGRRGARTPRRAVDEVLGQLDVLDELHMGIEVEGGRHDAVERARLVVIARRGQG